MSNEERHWACPCCSGNVIAQGKALYGETCSACSKDPQAAAICPSCLGRGYFIGTPGPEIAGTVKTYSVQVDTAIPGKRMREKRYACPVCQGVMVLHPETAQRIAAAMRQEEDEP